MLKEGRSDFDDEAYLWYNIDWEDRTGQSYFGNNCVVVSGCIALCLSVGRIVIGKVWKKKYGIYHEGPPRQLNWKKKIWLQDKMEMEKWNVHKIFFKTFF